MRYNKIVPFSAQLLMSMSTSRLPYVPRAPGSGPRRPLGPEIGVFLKYWTMGIIMSCIAYGVAFTLAVSTLFLLHKSSRIKKEKAHYILISYVIIMISLATVSISSGINANLAAIQSAKIPLNVNVGRDENAIIVVLVTWGSDGFLVSQLIIPIQEV